MTFLTKKGYLESTQLENNGSQIVRTGEQLKEVRNDWMV
jgi:hypothetical protein